MKAKILLTAIICFLLTGCTRYPDETKKALREFSKENRKKFEAVLKHYKAPEDSLKYKAACFMIENMKGNGAYKGKQLSDFNAIFDVLANKPPDYRENLPWYSDELTQLFDSIENIYGRLSYANMYFVKDEDTFTEESFITYIEESFRSWDNPWSRKIVSFNDFLNYVLPYRSFKELLEPWREMFMDKFKWIYDSITPNEDIINVARKLNIGSELKYSNGFGRYIVPIAPSDLLKAMYGNCTDNSNYKAMIMRSHGIPVAIDYLPQYGDDHNSHYWNVVMDRNGNFVSFEEALNDINAFVAYKYKIGKVYRKTFSPNQQLVELQLSEKDNLPSAFNDPKIEDVTNEYVAVSNVKVRLGKLPENVRYVYAAVFNDKEWTPIDFAKIDKNCEAVFNNLGRDVVFLPVFSVKGKLITAASPFKITPKGWIQYLEPSETKETVVLTRKYHYYKRKENWSKCLENGVFEGSNDPGFIKCSQLNMIDFVPGEHFIELPCNSKESFRYVRFRFSNAEQNLIYDGDGASLAELHFISKAGKILTGKPFGSEGRKYNSYTPNKCFDNNPLTFFEDARSGNVEKYVGLQFDKPQQIEKICFLARNDMNSIQKGDLYELFYWDNNGFQSLGQKVATEEQITISNVPKEALLLLRNLSAGKEERIFTYENGKQIWW